MSTVSSIRNFISLFLLSYLLWLLLTASFHPQELAAGFLVSLAAAILSLRHFPILNGLQLRLSSLQAIPAYLLNFLWALLRANLDMARRVLSPVIPLQPAMVTVKTSLQSDLGKLVLANSITLTPGTLSVDVEGDEIRVHWIDCPAGTSVQSATSEIAASFEKHLKGFLQ